MENFAIKNTKEKNLYWSNEFGWTNQDFDLFTMDESKTLNLPIDGKWVKHFANQLKGTQ